ncbi:MAG: hypothetical protein SFZ23_14350 [Planctomycetota bacterium]|nr:hypothetical protein [Planctomycetota bacterium]
MVPVISLQHNLAACVALVATAASAQELAWLSRDRQTPLVATDLTPLHVVDGVLVRGAPIPVRTFGARRVGEELLFDQYQGNIATGTDDEDPIGANLCNPALPPDARFQFGGARLPHVVNDFSGMPATGVGVKPSFVTLAWQHDPPVPEPIVIDLVWYDEFSGDCTGFATGGGSIVAARTPLGGFSVRFNNGAPVPPGQGYFAIGIDLADLQNQLPSFPDTDGAYRLSLLTQAEPAPVYATRSQFMRWGTQRDFQSPDGVGPEPDRPGGPGSPNEFFDAGGSDFVNAQVDGRFTTSAPGECFFTVSTTRSCIQRTGAMIAWFRSLGTDPGPFALLSPADQTQDAQRRPTFSWTPSMGASSYELRVSTSPDLSQPLLVRAGLTSTTLTLASGDELPTCVGVFWGVEAFGIGGRGRTSVPRSMSYFTLSSDPRADFNQDAQVDFFDFLDFAQAFGDENVSADFNSDGQVDFFDYLDFASAFGANC